MNNLSGLCPWLAAFLLCCSACNSDPTEDPSRLQSLSFRKEAGKEYLSVPQSGEYILTCIASPLTAEIPALTWEIDSQDGKIDFVRDNGAIVQTGRSVKIDIREANAEALISVTTEDGRIGASICIRSDGPEQQGVDSIYIRTIDAERVEELYPGGVTANYLSPKTSYGWVDLLPSNIENNGGESRAYCAQISVDMEQPDEIFFIQIVALAEVAEGIYEEMAIPEDMLVTWFAAQNEGSRNTFNINRYSQAQYADMPRDIARIIVKNPGSMGEGIVSVGSLSTSYRITTTAAAPASVKELLFTASSYDIALPPGKFKLTCEAVLDPAGGECPELVWSCNNPAFTLSRGSEQGNDLLEDYREIWVTPEENAAPGEMGIVSVTTLDGLVVAQTIVRLVEGSDEEIPLTGLYFQIYEHTNTFASGEFWADNRDNVTLVDLPFNNTKYLYIKLMPYPANTTEEIDFSRVSWTFEKGCFNAPTGSGATGLPTDGNGARIVATGLGSQPITVTYGDLQASIRINVVESLEPAALPEQIFVRIVPNPTAYWGILPEEGRIFPVQGISKFPGEWQTDNLNDVQSVTMKYAVPSTGTAYEYALYFEIETLPGNCTYDFNVGTTWSDTGQVIGSNSANNGNATGVNTRRIARIHPLDPAGKSPNPATVTITAGELVKNFQITVQ